MIINGNYLLQAAPIKNMLSTKERSNGVSHGLAEAGYDIRIKQRVVFTENNCIYVNGVLADKGKFIKASAIDEFQMPTNLVGVVHDKSTWARQGLSVFNTVIEAGWNGFLTLELVYHANEYLEIPAGAGIAQVLFTKMAQDGQYEGKYQNQADKPVDAVFEGEPM